MEVAKSVQMARSAKAAMLAAVEMYNKTVFTYREEVFCLLMINAWEILTKARIVQQAGNELKSIYQPAKNGARPLSRHTKTPLTVNLHKSLTRAGVPQNVRTNVEILSDIRNEVAHLGLLSGPLKQIIGEIGTASVQNFVKLLAEWFQESVDDIYILPVGFIGGISGIATQPDQRQRDLLHHLNTVVANAEVDNDYSVSIAVQVDVQPSSRGGGSIRPTNDPNAPEMRISEEDLKERYPDNHRSLTAKCRTRYSDFLQNQKYNDLLRPLKEDPQYAYIRKLDPDNPRSTQQVWFNAEAVFERLDKHYTLATE